MTALLLWLAAPRSSQASPEDDARATARAKLVEGGELLKQGEYAPALSRFQEAYDLVKSPKIQYNFGLAYMGLGRKADAVEAFEKFLAEATDANPDLRANAERHRSTLMQQVGTLVVECDADGAEISVDGRSRGVTPLGMPIRLDPGPHQLVVEKAGAPPFAERVTAVGGRRATVQAHLAIAAPPAAKAEPAPLPPPPVMAPAPSPVPQAEPELSPAERSARAHALERKLAWGTGALAVVGLGLGVVERLVANGKFQDFNSKMTTYGQCDADDRVRAHGGAGCDDLLSAGRSAQSRSTVGLIAGGALGVASGLLFYLSRPEGAGAPPSATSAASFSCVPELAARAELVCAARF